MTRIKIVLGVWILLLVASCSIEIADKTPVKVTASKVSPSTQSVAPTIPKPIAAPTLPSWSDLKISGNLIYTQGLNGLIKIDLATGKSTTIFKTPRDGWLRDNTISPDHKLIAITYAPPPPAGEVQFGYTDLYTLPIDGGEPTLILKRTDSQESYFHPTWSPDGKFIYYAHFIPVDKPNGQRSFRYTVERIGYPNGKPEILVEDAIWPRLSHDGKTLAYLSFDPKTFSNELFLADINGKNGKRVIKPETFVAVDAHFFALDDSAIIFSAVGEGKTSSSLNWLDRLFGVGEAKAHDVPSDWWRVDINTGKMERLTRVYDVGLYGGFSPDGKHIAYIAQSGVYVMKSDGSSLTPVATVNSVGTLEWIP